MNIETYENDQEFEAESTKLFEAFNRYREWVKRNRPQRLAGVMWITKGTELICYSENQKYSNQIKRLTHNAVGDSFSLTELPEE